MSAVSTVVVTLATRSRAAHLAVQREAVRRHLPGFRHLVVLLDDPGWTPWPGAWTVDASSAGPVELARARNTGGDAAVSAGAEHLVFLDVDCLPGPDLGKHYSAALRTRPDTVACGPVTYLDQAPASGYDLDALDDLTDPHPARPAPPDGLIRAATSDEYVLFWSLSFAVTASTWSAIRSRIGGFHERYRGYGGEDTDLGLALRESGVPMAWVGGAHAYHQHHPVSDPPVEHVDAILANGAVFRERWGFWPMVGWLEEFETLGLVRRDAEGVWTRSPGRTSS
ncbi:glycosyltransferase family 2 protein [Dietzia sp. 179-F 9C3 NHS]|uniref:glycosyltransferase family 2 protein n=1 Tax=Dietzia sp. 179-F 9C3 NHS TaxID=3374295 RepID=UPI0038799031